MRVNREAFEKLVREDKEWLLKQPRTLERIHIEEILDEITDLVYGKDDDDDDYPETTMVYRQRPLSDEKVERIIAAHEY